MGWDSGLAREERRPTGWESGRAREGNGPACGENGRPAGPAGWTVVGEPAAVDGGAEGVAGCEFGSGTGGDAEGDPFVRVAEATASDREAGGAGRHDLAGQGQVGVEYRQCLTRGPVAQTATARLGGRDGVTGELSEVVPRSPLASGEAARNWTSATRESWSFEQDELVRFGDEKAELMSAALFRIGASLTKRLFSGWDWPSKTYEYAVGTSATRSCGPAG
jgi:hypothetical protein